MRLRPRSTLLTAWLVLAWVASGGALGASAQEEPTARRLFLVFLGEPGLPVEIQGTSGEKTSASCNEEGLLRFHRVAAPDEVLRFQTPDPRWRLEAELKVPGGNPEIPVYLDLAAQLRRRPPSSAPSPPSTETPSTETPSTEAPPAEAPSAAPPPKEDPCREKRSLVCQMERWSRFETAMEERDCGAALAAAEQMMEEYPEFAAAGSTRRAFAEVYLDCGLAADGELREARLERALELLPEGGGAGWCDAVESRLLAAAFALRGPAAAATAAASAQELCPAATPPLEWAFYFRLQDGETETAAALTARAPRRLGLFLEAWLARQRGSCVSRDGTEITVELEASGDLPCRGLPQEICALPYAEHLLACGTGREDAATAALFLRSTLPADPTAWDLAAPEDRDTVELLAEAEWVAGRFGEAARLSSRLAASAADESEKRRHRRRRAEALLMRSENDREDAAAATAALEAWAALRRQMKDPGDEDAVRRAILLNNVAVLRARLGEGLEQDELAALEDAIAALPEEAADLRLVLRGHFLALAITVLERAPARDARGQLERLRILRHAFVEHEAELRATPPSPSRPDWVIAKPGAVETREKSTPDDATAAEDAAGGETRDPP